MAKEVKTLFVRNLPFSANKEKLEEVFSEHGPIKQCFVVTDKATNKSRGFGYIIFSLIEDAVSAKNNVKSIDGRKISIDFADHSRKKTREKEKSDMDGGPSKEEDDGFTVESPQKDLLKPSYENMKLEPLVVPEETEKQKCAKLKYHNAKILVLTGFSKPMTDKDVVQCLSELNVKKASDVKCLDPHMAHIKFKCVRDLHNAVRKLDQQSFEGSTLSAVQLSKVEDVVLPQKTLKRARLIVRNVSFKCQAADLEKAFEPFGTISEVHIPKNKDGKMFGFAFVQYTQLHMAKNALDSMNSVAILGRPVAVDWAIQKDRYDNMNKETSPSKAAENERTGKKEDSSEEDSDEEDSDEEEEEEMVQVAPKAVSAKNKWKALEESDDSDEDEDDDDSDESDNEMDSDSDEEDSDSVSDDEETVKKKDTDKRPPRKSDVDQGRTIFIRNLSFDSREDGMTEFFSKFGDVNYCKVVMDRKTEYSKGMAFVQFKTKDGTDLCLKEAKENDLVLDGRQLIVALAVPREDAAAFNEKKTEKKDTKDNRNLYLAREGMIRPGTQAAQGLSKEDLDKRQKVLELKQQKLKNINIFISTLRLCVRNIPINVDDKELKQAFLKAANNKTARINECRIMRDLARTNAKGVGKSTGFGFVAFTEHAHALAAMRNTNNNPEIFGENRRLIVEFSLENKKALEVKQKRFEKQQFLIKKAAEENSKTQGERPTTRRFAPSGKKGNIPGMKLSGEDRKQLKAGGKPLPKGLPSHWGPKVRHHPRNTEQPGKGKKGMGKKKDFKKPGSASAFSGQGTKPGQAPARGMKRQNETPIEMMKTNPKKGKKVVEDDFDRMVDNYKQKFTSNKQGRAKWFE